MPWELETASLCTTRPQLRHCAQNEVVEVECTLSQLEATTKGSEDAQKPFERLKRKNWRWRLVYDLSLQLVKRRKRVMMSWITCHQRWIKLWNIRGVVS